MIIDLKNHLALTSCADINQICEPLYKIGVILFIYEKIYIDGTKIVLSNNRAWNEHYFSQFYSLAYPNSIYFESQAQQGCLLISRELFPQLEAIIDATERFNFGNDIVIARQYKSAKELFYFAGSVNNVSLNNYYINNMEIFYTFINYFKTKAFNLIQLSDKSKITIPREYFVNKLAKEVQFSPDHSKLDQEILPLLKTDKAFLMDEGNEIYLTKQQMECARWLIQGKSAEEIAIILGISKRTTEEHIYNIKNKLNCYKITQLVYKLNKYSYLFE